MHDWINAIWQKRGPMRARLWLGLGCVLPGLLACPGPASMHTVQKRDVLSRELMRFNQKQHPLQAAMGGDVQDDRQGSDIAPGAPPSAQPVPPVQPAQPAQRWSMMAASASLAAMSAPLDRGPGAAMDLDPSALPAMRDGQRGAWKPPPKPRPTAREQIPGLRRIAGMYRQLGKRIVRSARYIRWRHLRLIRRCRNASARKPGCRVFKRSALMFAANYRTSSRNYRGYMLFHSKRKKKISRGLMRWYRRLSSKRFRTPPTSGRCYLSQGLASNCMSYAMCSQKAGLRRFRGTWGKGFQLPLWGYVNYWSTEAYDAHLQDYTRKGQRRPGINTLLRKYPQLSLRDKQRLSRRLLMDMYRDYTRRMRRSYRVNRRYYKTFANAFCTNVVVAEGSFSRALPGDLFVLSFPRKRRKQRRASSYRHQHWGLIVDPPNGKILHNQTPGGVWGRAFHRWGVQYDVYEPSFLKSRRRWKWNRHRRRYEQRAVFVNRVNLHFLLYARQRKQNIYRTKQNLCRAWIKHHSALYFADLAAASQ